MKEQSSNDGINDDLEDDRAAVHPGAIPQPESPVAIGHTQPAHNALKQRGPVE